MKKFTLALLITTTILSTAIPQLVFGSTGKQNSLVAHNISSNDIKEIFIEVDQAKLFCRIMGKGDPLVVIHGGPGLSQDYLLPQLKKLAKNNLVIFYDQRGSGESIGDINPQFIQLGIFIEDLAAIRKTFGFKQISILGHSFGGFLAMNYAIAHPEAIDKLVLLNSTPASSEDFALFMKEWSQRMAPFMKEIQHIEESKGFKEGDPATFAKFYKTMFRPYCFDSQKADELNLKMSNKANIDGPKTYAILQQNFFSKPYDLQDNLRKLKCKTLIIHGDNDPIPLNTAKNTHKNINNSKFVVIKECGHFPYIEKPQELFFHLHAFLK